MIVSPAALTSYKRSDRRPPIPRPRRCRSPLRPDEHHRSLPASDPPLRGTAPVDAAAALWTPDPPPRFEATTSRPLTPFPQAPGSPDGSGTTQATSGKPRKILPISGNFAAPQTQKTRACRGGGVESDSLVSRGVHEDQPRDLAADDDGETCSQTSDPIEESQPSGTCATSRRNDCRGGDTVKPMESLSVLKRRIRIPNLAPRTPDLSKFQIPRAGREADKTCVEKYSPISDGFVGSELSLPPKQNRLRRLRGGRPALSGCLEIVRGELPVPDGFEEVSRGQYDESSPDRTSKWNGAQQSLEGLSLEDESSVPVVDSSEGHVWRRDCHGRQNRLLEQDESQRDRDDVDEEQEYDPTITGKSPWGLHLDPRTAADLARVVAPARIVTEDEQDTDEGEGESDEDYDEEGTEASYESERRESEDGNEQHDGATSEVGNSSDWTGDDGTHLADAGNPLMKRVQDDNAGEDDPDALSASEMFSDRISSTRGTSADGPAAIQHRPSLLSRETQYRNALSGRIDRLALPGQAARMRSSGVWMEVQEEILFTPALKRKMSDDTQKEYELKGSVVSSEDLGSSPPVPGTGRLVAAAAVSANFSQRTGRGRAGDSGNFSRRFSTHAKDLALRLTNKSDRKNAAPGSARVTQQLSYGHANLTQPVPSIQEVATSGQKQPTRRRSQVLVRDHTRDYFSASRQALFADNSENIPATPLFTDHIGPADDEDVEMMKQNAKRRRVLDDLRLALPRLPAYQYSQHRTANPATAAQAHLPVTGASDVMEMSRTSQCSELPSLLLDPPFLR